MKTKIVIIGGGQSGGRSAQLLSKTGDNLDITLISAEAYPPYYRPPLSKGVLMGEADLDDCLIWPENDPAWKNVNLLTNVSSSALDTKRKVVRLSNGDLASYDKLVIATGSHVRRYSARGNQQHGVYSLRTFDDAKEISRHFRKGKRLIIIGGGFIGLEVAAAARQRGLAATVIEATDRLLARIAPKNLSDAVEQQHRAAGVEFRFSAMVEEFMVDTAGALKAVRLSTDEVVRCDLAVVGVGVTSNVQLARSAGLPVEVGIQTNQSLQTTDPDVYACGDCASFWHPLFGRHIRMEAWQNAEDHARVVSSCLTGEQTVCDTVPFFWSDQYDWSMQIVGLPHLGSSVVTHRVENAFILYHLDGVGRMVAATGFGEVRLIGREIRRARQAIARRTIPLPQGLVTGEFVDTEE